MPSPWPMSTISFVGVGQLDQRRSRAPAAARPRSRRRPGTADSVIAAAAVPRRRDGDSAPRRADAVRIRHRGGAGSGPCRVQRPGCVGELGAAACAVPRRRRRRRSSGPSRTPLATCAPGSSQIGERGVDATGTTTSPRAARSLTISSTGRSCAYSRTRLGQSRPARRSPRVELSRSASRNTSGVESACSDGRTTTGATPAAPGTASTCSPAPVTNVRSERAGRGTSAPSCRRARTRDRPGRDACASRRNAVAASPEPPPIPAATGTCLSIVSRTGGIVPAGRRAEGRERACREVLARARRRTRPRRGSPACVVSVSSSASDTGCTTRDQGCLPSARERADVTGTG